ncbi:MAG: molecular chaperone [Candidatus Velthaea sp.]
MKRGSRKGAAVWAAVALIMTWACPAAASEFTVDPVSIHVSKAAPGALLTIQNRGDAPLRMQIETFAWDQRVDGTMALAPTNDVVVFPEIFTVAAHAARRVRAAVTAPPAATERTYRIFLEELPSLESIVQPHAGVLTFRARVGIPVFFAPLSPAFSPPGIQGAAVRAGALHFDVVNTGNVHAFVKQVRVVGLNDAGKETFVRDVAGWYVLPFEPRSFDVTLPHDVCQSLATLRIDASATQSRTVAMDRNACGR